jgi:hypothetical protein
VPVVLLMGVASLLHLPSYKNTLNSTFLVLKCLCVVALSLYAISLIYLKDKELQGVGRRVHLWIPVIMLFHQITTISSWIVYQPKLELGRSITGVMDYVLVLVNIQTYICYAMLIFYYRKLNPAYV